MPSAYTCRYRMTSYLKLLRPWTLNSTLEWWTRTKFSPLQFLSSVHFMTAMGDKAKSWRKTQMKWASSIVTDATLFEQVSQLRGPNGTLALSQQPWKEWSHYRTSLDCGQTSGRKKCLCQAVGWRYWNGYRSKKRLVSLIGLTKVLGTHLGRRWITHINVCHLCVLKAWSFQGCKKAGFEKNVTRCSQS